MLASNDDLYGMLVNVCIIQRSYYAISPSSYRRVELASVGEKALAALASRVRAPGTPQAHLDARRAALAVLIVGQVIRDDIGERANKDWRVVERFGAVQGDAELRDANASDKSPRLPYARHTSCASSATSRSNSYSVSI